MAPIVQEHSMRLQNSSSNALNGMLERMVEPVDITFLIFLRIAFGSVMLWEVCQYFGHDWIRRYYIEPEFHFTYYGFSWVKPWGPDGMNLHFIALGFLAACIIAGCCYRLAATLFFLGFTYIFLLDEARYLNHFYLISLISFTLIFMPAEQALSLDAWLRPQIRSESAPAWTLWWLRAQIGIAYFFGGIAKLNMDWLRGEPMRMWLSNRMDFPLIGSFFKEEWMVYLFVTGGLLFDLLIVPLLLWKRTRLPAFLASMMFHLTNARLFQIGIFPWLMMAATLIFFPPDLPRRLIQQLGLGKFFLCHQVPDDFSIRSNNVTRRTKLIGALLMIYLFMQALIPFRHFAYPGNAHWTEEGHRFSWHMKLRSKSAEALFKVTDPTSNQSWTIDPRLYLTPLQLEKMTTHPDMILQFSHHLADVMKRKGYQDVQVRADVMASLNGRKSQRLIDPAVDLTKEHRNLLPARWILPLTEPLSRSSASEQSQNTD